MELEKQFAEIIKEYSAQLRTEVEKGLSEAGKVAIAQLQNASPVGDTVPHFKDLWEMKTKYKGVRYVGNTKTVPAKSGNIPLSNILEYGPHAQPFIARTFEAGKDEIYMTFIKSIEGGK